MSGDERPDVQIDAPAVSLRVAVRTAGVWDAATGKLLARTGSIRFGPIEAVAFSPDGRRVATCGLYDARVWNARSRQPVTTELGDPSSRMNAITFSPDGKRVLATGENAQAVAWDAQTGAQLLWAGGFDDYCRRAFSPDGTRFIAIGMNQVKNHFTMAVGLWKVPSRDSK